MLDWMKTALPLADDPVNGFDPDAVTISNTVEINAPARHRLGSAGGHAALQ
jgi:hypothetical protein